MTSCRSVTGIQVVYETYVESTGADDIDDMLPRCVAKNEIRDNTPMKVFMTLVGIQASL